MDDRAAGAQVSGAVGWPRRRTRRRGAEPVSLRMTRRRWTIRATALVMVTGTILLCLEIAFRILDRQPLTRVVLNPQPPSAAVTGRAAGLSPDVKHVAQ